MTLAVLAGDGCKSNLPLLVKTCLDHSSATSAVKMFFPSSASSTTMATPTSPCTSISSVMSNLGFYKASSVELPAGVALRAVSVLDYQLAGPVRNLVVRRDATVLSIDQDLAGPAAELRTADALHRRKVLKRAAAALCRLHACGGQRGVRPFLTVEALPMAHKNRDAPRIHYLLDLGIEIT